VGPIGLSCLSCVCPRACMWCYCYYYFSKLLYLRTVGLPSPEGRIMWATTWARRAAGGDAYGVVAFLSRICAKSVTNQPRVIIYETGRSRTAEFCDEFCVN
jgi:hypothetical protein